MNVLQSKFEESPPLRGDCFNAACQARIVFDHVTGRWGGLVLAALLPGTLRFSALRARIGGISEKMLAQTLREFERDGLLERRQFPQVPPRVEYELTAAGLEVAQRLYHLIGWLEDHVPDLIAARQRHDLKRENHDLERSGLSS